MDPRSRDFQKMSNLKKHEHVAALLVDESFFADVINPTSLELLAWSHAHSHIPCQDFELFVVNDPEFTLSLVEDKHNLLQDFFLGSLYVFIGDLVRTKREGEKEKLRNFLETAKRSNDHRIKKLVERGYYLLNNPNSYTYEDRGIGGNYSKE